MTRRSRGVLFMAIILILVAGAVFAIGRGTGTGNVVEPTRGPVPPGCSEASNRSVPIPVLSAARRYGVSYDNGISVLLAGGDGSSPSEVSPGGGLDPSWAANGLRFAAVRGDSVEVVQLKPNGQGGEPRAIAPGDVPAMSPSGDFVAFARDHNLYVATFDGSGITGLGRA